MMCQTLVDNIIEVLTVAVVDKEKWDDVIFLFLFVEYLFVGVFYLVKTNALCMLSFISCRGYFLASRSLVRV